MKRASHACCAGQWCPLTHAAVPLMTVRAEPACCCACPPSPPTGGSQLPTRASRCGCFPGLCCGSRWAAAGAGCCLPAHASLIDWSLLKAADALNGHALWDGNICAAIPATLCCRADARAVPLGAGSHRVGKIGSYLLPSSQRFGHCHSRAPPSAAHCFQCPPSTACMLSRGHVSFASFPLVAHTQDDVQVKKAAVWLAQQV